jgi:hypothetical protein
MYLFIGNWMSMEAVMLRSFIHKSPYVGPIRSAIGARIRVGMYNCTMYMPSTITAYIMPLYRALLFDLKVVLRCRKKLDVCDMVNEHATDRNPHNPPEAIV